MFLVLFSILVFLCVNGLSESADIEEFRDLIKELKDEMAELRKIHLEDSETIRSLQVKVHRYVSSGKLSTQADSLSDLKALGGEPSTTNPPIVREDEFQARLLNPNKDFIGNVRSKPDSEIKLEYLHQELNQVKKQIEEITVPSGGITVRWLQRAVEGLRREMREMAVSVNTSAALADKQHTATNFALLRSDVVALGHRMDTVRVDRERNAALIKQLRLDTDEIRQRLQESALEQQKLFLEVDTLKEELREQIVLSNTRKLFSGSSEKHLEKDDHLHKTGDHHHKFRHDNWKREVSYLQEKVNDLQFTQTDQTKRLQVLIGYQASQNLKISSLERDLQRNEHQSEESSITNQRLEILENLVNKTELQTHDIKSSINNITTTGIKKLHGSTVQLFKALERLESNYDKSTDDIRKEISKLDYNLSQTQSNVEDSGRNSKQVTSNIKDDLTTLQSDVKSNKVRLLLLQNALLNRTNGIYETAMQKQDAKISELEYQIQSLSNDIDVEKVEIDDLHNRIGEKADFEDFQKFEKEQQKIRESILQFKEDIPKIRSHQTEIKQELDMFNLQLPGDCAEYSSLEDTLSRQSGTILIRNPVSDSSMTSLEVFCDMETSSGQWTLVQRRSEGDQNFNRDWKSYKDGFGNVGDSDFWLGNEVIHKLTAKKDYMLRIDMWDVSGKYMYAEYSAFRVLSEDDNYRLVISKYSGNASDAMNYHNGMSFSTPDRDNDASLATHCADFYSSGWWYNHCQYVNINGRFNTGMTWYNINGQEWSELTKVEMKVKPRTLLAS